MGSNASRLIINHYRLLVELVIQEASTRHKHFSLPYKKTVWLSMLATLLL
jgi:hypothetical protein